MTYSSSSVTVNRFISPSPSVFMTTLSVEEMDFLLKNYNNRNRPVSKKDVEVYKNDISNGKWVFDGCTVGFSTDGQIVNGQHRFIAHVETNTPLTTGVAVGLNPESIKTIDRPHTRTFAQNAAISYCIENGEEISQSLIRVIKLRQGVAKEICRWDGYKNLSDKKVLELSNTVLKKELDFVINFPIVNKYARRAGVLSAVALYYRRSPEKATEFLTHLAGDGSNVPNGPILKLRNYISEGNSGGWQVILYDHTVTVKAIHHHYFGTEMLRIGNKKLPKNWEF